MPQISGNLLLLTRCRWNAPILAGLVDGPRTFTELARALQASRDSISRSLKALQASRWIQHRKTWSLTRQGKLIAPRCQRIVHTAGEQDVTSVIFKRWSLPVAAALQNWSLHFNELRAFLPDITPRALTLALKEMQAAGLIHREIVGGFPPAAAYRLTEAGGLYLPALLRL